MREYHVRFRERFGVKFPLSEAVKIFVSLKANLSDKKIDM